jgi:hypothetical protein
VGAGVAGSLPAGFETTAFGPDGRVSHQVEQVVFRELVLADGPSAKDAFRPTALGDLDRGRTIRMVSLEGARFLQTKEGLIPSTPRNPLERHRRLIFLCTLLAIALPVTAWAWRGKHTTRGLQMKDTP